MCGAWHPIAVGTGVIIARHILQAFRYTVDVITMFIDTHHNQAWLTVFPAVVHPDAAAFVVTENLLEYFLAERFSVDTGSRVRKLLLILFDAGTDLMCFKLPAGAVKRKWFFYVFHCLEGFSRSFLKYVA